MYPEERRKNEMFNRIDARQRYAVGLVKDPSILSSGNRSLPIHPVENAAMIFFCDSSQIAQFFLIEQELICKTWSVMACESSYHNPP